MPKYLDFENQEKGYEPFRLTAENIKKNAGKKIVYLRRADVDTNRGFVFPRYATIHGKRYSNLYINEYGDSIDIRDVIECGIEIEPLKSEQ